MTPVELMVQGTAALRFVLQQLARVRVRDRTVPVPAAAPVRPSVVVDVEPYARALHAAICSTFKLASERVVVQTSGAIDGASTVIIVDVQVDGEPAPPEVWKLIEDVNGAARELNKSRKVRS